MSFQKFTAKDIAVDEDFDLKIEGGDLVVEPSDDRHVNMILISARGNFLFNPTVGVDLFSFLNSTGQADVLRRDIQEQMTLDGFRVDDIQFSEENDKLGSININAKRIR